MLRLGERYVPSADLSVQPVLKPILDVGIPRLGRIRKGRPVTSELGLMRACAAARRRPAVADGST
jgi:hypothetical protein